MIVIPALLLVGSEQIPHSSGQEYKLCCNNGFNLLSPLMQFRDGIAVQDTKCATSLILVLKLEDSSPKCVRSDTATKLIERGWAKMANRLDIVSLGPICDLNCKNDYENYGGICTQNSNGLYTCRNVSEHTIWETIPWSYTGATIQNFIPL